MRHRGSVYIAVLGAAMLVALIGVTGVMVNRVQYRTASANEGITEAGLLARSAIELALHRIATTPTWRSTYTHDTWTAERSLGAGAISFKLVDTEDTSLSDNANDDMRVIGRGQITDPNGSVRAMRMYSVDLKTDTSATQGFRVVMESWRRVVEGP